MAIYFEPQRPGLDPAESFGSGLSQALQLLAQNKLQGLQQRNVATGLQALNQQLSPEQAQQLSGLGPELLRPYVSQLMQAPQQAAFAQALQQLGGYEQIVPQQDGMQLQQQDGEPVEPQEGITEKQRAVIPAGITEKQATTLAKLGLQQRGQAAKEKALALRETRAFRESALGGMESAKDELHRLDRLINLEKEGKLDSPSKISFLKQAGIDIPALMKEGTQEYVKIVQDFQRGAKDAFGGRVSNFEVEQFLKTLPNLMGTAEGRKRVIANLRYLAEGRKELGETTRDVLKKYKGIPPFDLQILVSEELDKKREERAERFKKNLEMPVPEPEGSWKNIIAHYAGKAAGALPGLVKTGAQAGLGAAIGARFGGPYGAFGGGLGALLSAFDNLKK